ncbi:MAG: hypothetical protein CR989_02340 [Flavobacteriales bacterium]|nr:MAG: hypothetical protein CR989_02340 [Flavobacteriales bacterium]
MIKKLATVLMFFCSMWLVAQTTVTGTVIDAKSGEPLPGVSVKIVGKALGTTSDFDGNYTIKLKENPPFDIEFSILGYNSQVIEIGQNQQNLDVSMEESETSLDEVVISASRTPESIRESPVTVERMDVRDIKNTSSVSFYQGLENLKGVDVSSNSLTFNSVNTRGFATFANTRFMQLVDGMDNASPALNFPLGNLLGMSELDVESVELLPGASSALYGANAFNGILFMTSKSPFDHPGISAFVKTGLTTQEAAGTNSYFDGGVRAAYIFSEKFAAKTTFSFLKGTEFFATDYRDYDNPQLQSSDPAYNGLNIYGDEVANTFDWTALGGPVGVTVARTGYMEKDLMDYNAESAKFDVALHFRPFENDFEIIWNTKVGTGNTIYQGANRYAIKDFTMQQHKLEFRNDNFFVRGYHTAESAGDSYDSRFAAINMNKMAKDHRDWFTDYTLAYNGALLNPALGGIFDGIAPTPFDHDAARAFADNNLLNNNNFTGPLGQFQLGALNNIITQLTGGLVTQWNRSDDKRYVPGSDAFKEAFAKVIENPDLTEGAKFQDNSSLYHVDANYNFAHLTKVVEVQVGGSYRQYRLNSFGTIFTDYDGVIPYDEYGAYLQLQKKFGDDKLKFTGSIRYDKSQNFDGNYSPRVSLVFSPDENKKHNFRASYQTGFRNPTTQDQYIGLDLGNVVLVGSASDNLDRYRKTVALNPTPGIPVPFTGTVEFVGRQGYENAFTLSSVRKFSQTKNPADLEKSNVELIKPEEVKAMELGYRGMLGKVAIDVSGYYNKYTNFIDLKTVVAPLYGSANSGDAEFPLAVAALANGDSQPFQTYTNTSVNVNSYGGSLGINTKIGRFNLDANYTYARLDFNQAEDPDFKAGFNTPEHKVNLSFGSTELFKNFGFNINYRWQDTYFYQASFVNGKVAARNVVNAQINYSIPKILSTIKFGGTNIGGDEYVSAPGVGSIGSMYYLSWTVNM